MLHVNRRIVSINKRINVWFPGAPYRFKSYCRQYSIEPGISATEFQFYHSCLEPGLGRRGLWIFVRASTEKGGAIEVITD